MALHQLWVYATEWSFLPAPLMHLRVPFPSFLKAILICISFRLVPVLYHANRTETIILSKLWRALRSADSIRAAFANCRPIFANKLRCVTLITLIVRIILLEYGIADTQRIAPFSEVVLYRSTGFRKGLDCLSGTSRKQERKFMLNEARKCGMFEAPENGPAMHSYAQFVRTLDGNESTCLPKTNKKMFGSIKLDKNRFQGPKNATLRDLEGLQEECKVVERDCAHVIAVRTLVNTTWVALKSPQRRIVIHLRNDVQPNLTVLREVILAEAQGLGARAITRILLGVMLTYQYAPCFMHGRVIEGARRVPHLTFNPALLGLLLIIEIILWNLPNMREQEPPESEENPQNSDDDGQMLLDVLDASLSDTDFA